MSFGKVMTRSWDTLVERATLALQNSEVFVTTPLGLNVEGAEHMTAPGALVSPAPHGVQAAELPTVGLNVLEGHTWIGAPPGQ